MLTPSGLALFIFVHGVNPQLHDVSSWLSSSPQSIITLPKHHTTSHQPCIHSTYPSPLYRPGEPPLHHRRQSGRLDVWNRTMIRERSLSSKLHRRWHEPHDCQNPILPNPPSHHCQAQRSLCIKPSTDSGQNPPDFDPEEERLSQLLIAYFVKVRRVS
ncbi:hypothetical protein GGR50DRAFT_549011 [Xylaria sp. CBS 124048]|nr:hypothetical protein GGR50DRAFT_549011 [Xylaria sp. CBS 124048]